MTAVDPRNATPGSEHQPGASLEDRVLTALCPYLAASDGTWRSAGFAREHRCGAVSPPAILAAEKQRRLCLTEAHWTCSTYEAARAARPILPDRPPALPRPIARTTPVILDHGRIAVTMPAFRAERPTGQAILVVLLGLAFVLLVLARLSADGTPVGAVVAGASTSPRASVSVPASVTPTADLTTAPPTSPSADPGASGAPSTPAATPVPPVTSAKTYTVKRGDTLSTIADRFKTTSKILQELNGIADPSKISIGQVIKLP